MLYRSEHVYTGVKITLQKTLLVYPMRKMQCSGQQLLDKDCRKEKISTKSKDNLRASFLRSWLANFCTPLWPNTSQVQLPCYKLFSKYLIWIYLLACVHCSLHSQHTAAREFCPCILYILPLTKWGEQQTLPSKPAHLKTAGSHVLKPPSSWCPAKLTPKGQYLTLRSQQVDKVLQMPTFPFILA